MHGSVARKLARLGGYPLTHPQDLGRYLGDRLRPRSPLERGVPWIAYPAIDFLEGWLRPEMRVFEWGSGGSTLFFARRAAHLTSIETDRAWHADVAAALAHAGLDNVDLQLVEATPRTVEEAEAAGLLAPVRTGGFDVVFVDAADFEPNPHWLRPACFFEAERVVQPGGVVVVDDSWRYPELARHRARERRTFKGTGPARPGVTTTDVFFY